MDFINPSALKLLADAGTIVVVLFIYFNQQRNMKEENRKREELYLAESDKKDAQYKAMVERLFKNIDDDLKYKELLTGYMAKLDTKLDLQNRR